MAQEQDQAARREPVVARDRYSRKWESVWDTVGKGTCAPINPRGWSDPLNTPQKYVRIVRDEEGNRVVDVDLERWKNDLEEAHRVYDQKLYNDAVMLFGEAGPKAYEDKSPALIHFTGEPPMAVELVYAALDENSWALGKTTTPDPRLLKYFAKREKARPSFKDLDEAVALEEQVDPEASGGKRVPVKSKPKQAVGA